MSIAKKNLKTASWRLRRRWVPLRQAFLCLCQPLRSGGSYWVLMFDSIRRQNTLYRLYLPSVCERGALPTPEQQKSPHWVEHPWQEVAQQSPEVNPKSFLNGTPLYSLTVKSLAFLWKVPYMATRDDNTHTICIQYVNQWNTCTHHAFALLNCCCSYDTPCWIHCEVGFPNLH